MLTMVNPIDFGDHSSKVKVTMVIIDKCGVRGDAMLCVVIFFVGTNFRGLNKNDTFVRFKIRGHNIFFS